MIRMTIVSKVMLISIGMVTAMVLLFAYRTYSVNIVTFKKLEEQKLAVLGQSVLPILSANAALGFIDANRNYLREVLEQTPELLKVEVRDRNGSVQIMLRQKGVSREHFEAMHEYGFTYTAPIRDSITEQTVADLTLYYSRRDYDALLEEHLAFLWQALFFAAGMIAFIYLLLQRALSPLKQISRHLAGYDPHRPFEPLAYEKHDEIATINDALAQMIARMEHFSFQLQEKSRLAAMGEMIGNIAHQWRQPLMNINAAMLNLDRAHELGRLNAVQVEETVEKVTDLTEHMSQTIEDFRNYFRPDKPKSVFRLDLLMQKALTLMHAGIKDIPLACTFNNPVTVCTHEGEMLQVMQVIIANAMDAMHQRRIEHKCLWIDVACRDGRAFLSIKDNAGGIDPAIIDKIFDPYFTTKDRREGTGLGLYMARQIVEHSMGGTLHVRNTPEGAEFTISIPMEAS